MHSLGGRLSAAVFALLAIDIAGCAAHPATPLVRPSTATPHHTVIRIAQFTFDPKEATVAVGDTVEWVNADIVPHTATADSGAWTSPEFGAGQHFQWIASRDGRFPYHCDPHPEMTALLVVTR